MLMLRWLGILIALEYGDRKFGTDTHFEQVFYYRLNKILKLHWQSFWERLVTFNLPLRAIYIINLLKKVCI